MELQKQALEYAETTAQRLEGEAAVLEAEAAGMAQRPEPERMQMNGVNCN